MMARTGNNRERSGFVIALVLATFLALSAASMAWAQSEPYSNDDPVVKPTLIVNDADPGDPPLEKRITCCTLPFTGGDVTVYLVFGLVAVSVGTLLVRRTRVGRQDH